MIRRLLLLIPAAATLVLTGCGAAAVSTGYLSHQLCGAVFIAGREPERYYRDAIEPLAGPLAGLTSYTVDRERQEVRARVAGLAESRAALRPPYGCSFGAAPGPQLAAPPEATSASDRPEAPEAVPAGPLAAALNRAFDEQPQPPYRHTEAIVVVHRGRIVAERYAPGIGVATPLAGWSATKSVTNALVGILVQQGRLDMQAPAPIAEWSDPADPRHAITPEQLLRMSSGLDMGQSLHAGLGTAFDPTARMIFADPDTAADAARAGLAHTPGTAWNYSNANTQLLSRIVRDQAGGTASAALAFARRELFDRLGMRHATLEFDAAGTPVGASHLWASARDWARLGQLYLDDGVVDGERLLPAGWAAWSAEPTPGSEDYGYAAGFWTNRGAGAGARWRIEHGMPADAFMARGSHGQYVIVMPSQDLVLVRLGPAWTERDDMGRVAQLAREVIAALPAIATTGAPLR